MHMIQKVFRFMSTRLFLVALMIVFQMSLLAYLVFYFSRSLVYVYLLFNFISALATIGVVAGQDAPSYKLTWAVAILVFPLVGGVFYLLLSRRSMPHSLLQRVENMLESTRLHMPSNHAYEEALHRLSPHLALQSRYIYNVTGYPLMGNTQAAYFSLGDTLFPCLLQELRAAERYIFLEFFIVRPGLFWDSVLEVLKQKTQEGVEVRMMYDDLGSILTLPKRCEQEIRRAGIRLCVFNPFRPRLNVMLNHRDHRKIVVIDGKTAFCGGLNLADEYINRYERYGHWKDTGVMLRGDAAWAFTFMFLQQWQFGSGEPLRYEAYHPAPQTFASDGLVQVFGDSPLDNINATETIYLHVIARAARYIYIATPYLVIDKEMENALCSAAQSGVDVRIFTPHIYDKWYVHLLTRSHYDTLVKSGVQVYEYTPGFLHAKMFVADDEVCMVGTCNMDFRSFYLHFECGVVFYNASVVQKVKRDLLECQMLSHKIQPGEAEKIPLFLRLVRAFLKLFAPLM